MTITIGRMAPAGLLAAGLLIAAPASRSLRPPRPSVGPSAARGGSSLPSETSPGVGLVGPASIRTLGARPLSLPDPVALRAQEPTPAVPKLVFALYYPWYSLKLVSGQDRHVDIDPVSHKLRNFAHTPAAGIYDSSDPATIARQLAELKSAGVDVLACWWLGSSDFTAASIRKLLPQAQAQGLKVCLFLGRLERVAQKGDMASAGAELTDIVTEFAHNPGYLTVNGRPVVFVYDTARDQLSNAGWASVLLQLEKTAPPGIFAVGDIEDGVLPTDAQVFDGLHFNNPSAFVSLLIGSHPRSLMREQIRHSFHEGVARNAATAARAGGRVYVATVSPGIDNRRHRPSGLPVFYVDRDNGRCYQESWDAAIASSPDWVLLQSFNQWEEGTEIEPSVEFGDAFLKGTAAYTARFKAGAASPQSIRPRAALAGAGSPGPFTGRQR